LVQTRGQAVSSIARNNGQKCAVRQLRDL